MNKSLLALASAVCLAIAPNSSLAQDYATVPVGFIKVTIAAAADANTPRLTPISIPFYGTSNGVSAYTGALSAVTSNTLSITGTPWVATQFTSGSPHLARIKSAANKPGVGFSFLITNNTTNELTLNSLGLDLTTLVDPNDTFEIVTANTLGSTFGTQLPTQQNPVGTTGVVALLPGSTANNSDNVMVWGIPQGGTTPGWLTYYFSSSAGTWRQSGSGANQNNAVLYPDEGFFVRRRATSPVDLVLSGTVPSTQEKSEIPGPYNTFIATRFPIDMTLKTPSGANFQTGLDLQSSPGWQAGSTANNSDNVLVWGIPSGGTTPGWLTFFYSSSSGYWRQSGSGANQDGYVIPAGSAVFIRRISTVSGSAAYFAHALPYSLN
jgi:uncharacterized protein (TIGR02597 family)